MTRLLKPIWESSEDLSVSPSHLFSLKPMGVGTPYIESLSSYIKRLAQQHHLWVVDLLEFCAEQTDKNVMLTTTHKFHGIDGLSGSGRTWSLLLSELTQHPDVRYLSMAYWDFVLNPYRLLKQHHTWCPLCYAASQQAGTPVYTPLIWKLQAVDVCLVHRVNLLVYCPHCNKRFRSMSSNAVCGFCPKCQRWLGDTTYESGMVSTQTASYQRARTVGQLLALAPEVKEFSPNIVPRVIESLKENKGIPYTHIERQLSMATSQLSDLKAGVRLPNLNTLTRLADYSEGLLWFTLTQLEQFRSVSMVTESNQTQIQHPQQYLEQLVQSSERLPALKTIAKQCGYAHAIALRAAYPMEYEKVRHRVRSEQRQALQSILDGDDIRGVTQIARCYGYEQSVLFHFFPDLCREISRVVPKRLFTHCHDKLQAIIASDDFPGAITIYKSLGVGSYYLWQRFPDELNQIATLRQAKIQQQNDFAQAHLDAALESDDFPPQSLHQLAMELGRTARFLKNKFPIRSQHLLQRWQSYKTQQVQATCNQIRQIVFDLHQQGIYPSVDRLHAEISTWMIHGKIYRDVYNQALLDCGYLVTNA